LIIASAEDIGPPQTVRFHLHGYERPAYRFERPLAVNATVDDADGAKLAITLSQDENGRLFELQIIRFEPGDVMAPNWATLRLATDDETIDLDQQ
jgi:hypothetical protein